MRKFYLFLLSAVLGTQPFQAQDVITNGFYRVQNYTTKRYISVIDNRGSINYTTNSADLQAIQSLKGFERVESNPGSIIYIQYQGTSTAGRPAYNLGAQGTSMYEIIAFYVDLQHLRDNMYYALKTKEGTTVYLSDRNEDVDVGQLSTSNTKTRAWCVIPVTTDDNQYLGVAPQVKVGDQYYQTLYASYGYKMLSDKTKAYYITGVKDGIAIWKEVSGTVPPATPVIIQSTSSKAVDNKLEPMITTPTSVSGNQLKGVYFNCDLYKHVNQVAFNASTMRVLGKLSDGSLGFVNKCSSQFIPANTAYLQVPAGTPAELRLMTQAEFDAEQERLNTPVTLTAKSFTRVYGEANPALEYTVSGTLLSGKPALSCQATATSPVGTYPIVVSVGTVENRNKTLVNGTLTITPAPLQVSVTGTYTREVGEENPAFQLSYSGFKNNETESVLTEKPVVSTTATADSPVGTYPITLSGGQAQNYTLSYQNGELTVTPATQKKLTLTARSYTRTYGDENPTFVYDVQGKLLSGEATLTCEATATSPVGTYPIVISQGSIGGSGHTLVNGTLTIEPAPLTVSVGSYSREQHEENPSFELTYEGFKNGETERVLSSQPQASTVATAESPVGTYDIVVAGGQAQNYTFSYQNGQLIVTPETQKLLTLTAHSYTRVYGDENPAFEVDVEGKILDGEPSVSCEATVLSPVGTYPIVVVQGSIDGEGHTLVNGTLTIEPAPLTISVGDYLREAYQENPEFKIVYAGFKNSETEDVLTTKPVATTEATIDSDEGVYEIVVSGASAENYVITYVNGKLTVSGETQKPLTITAASFKRTYGDANPELTYTIQGKVIGGQPDITCEATATSPVGEYPIVVSQGTLRGSGHQLINGTLTITPAPLLAAVGNYSRMVGKENPEFTISYIGFRNGETEDVLTTAPTATTEATVTSPEGTYDIIVSGGEAENYTFVYRNGKLTVKPDMTAVDDLLLPSSGADVYGLSGRLVRRHATTLQGLSKGVYVVEGRKFVVR
ncbi:MAG: hypothetical protein J6W75_10665 [Bacteroidaceae bacterium]|nr:hypothetical protein [Bacteroidaceae bacterium]